MPSLTTVFAATAAAIGCMFFGSVYMKHCKRKNYRRAFWHKGFAGLCFVLVGAFLLPYTGNRVFADFTLTGLILGLIADEILILRKIFPKKHTQMFALGTVVFATGHFFYIKALSSHASVSLPILIAVLLPMLGIAYYYGKLQGSNAGKLQIAAAIYMGLVVLMGAFSVTTAILSPGVGTLLFALGGICFAVSDNVLLAYSYGSRRTWNQNVLVHVTYYAAQLLIAWSILLMGVL